jgi:hypothetical protein
VTRRHSPASYPSVADESSIRNAALVAENQRLARDNARLMRKLRRTEAILKVQNKLSEILGIELPPNDYVKDP